MPTISPTATWTPGPLLSLEEQQVILDELISTNGGCEFPCWWGITPGETTWEEMRAFFNKRGIRIRVEGDGSTLYAILALDETIYSAWGSGGVVVFRGQQGLVRSIQVIGRVADAPSVQEIVFSSLNEYLAQFSLSRVLSTYGVPSQVYVSGSGTCSHSDTTGPYNLWVEYADVGILFGYSGYTVGNYAEYHVCPTRDGVNKIELWFQSPSSTFSDIIELASVESDSKWYWEDQERVLEEMSVEEFYEAFRQAEGSGCLRILEGNQYEVVRPTNLSPVLTAEEDAGLIEMLQTNGDCELPCWWGITPGVTSVQDAQQVFLAYGKPIGILGWSSGETQYEVGAFGRHVPMPFDYVVRQRFSAEDDTVSYICVTGAPPVWALYSQHLVPDWQRYSLSSTLARFGSPSQVSVFHHHPNCGETYWLHVLYDDLGIRVSYSGIVHREAGIVTICPASEDLISIQMTLAAPISATGAGLESRGIECGYIIHRGWDSGVDLDFFFQAFVNPETQTCLEFPEQSEYTCP